LVVREAGTWAGFNGTIGSLIRFYQIEPSSPYHKLEPASLRPYAVYAHMITETVGTRRLDALDGRDLDRWFAEWSAPLERGGRQRLAAARMAMIVLKRHCHSASPAACPVAPS
jgi:hypothetical protein